MSSEDMSDPVDQLSIVVIGFFSECGQSAILLIGAVGNRGMACLATGRIQGC